MTKHKKIDDLQHTIDELTLDLQRTRADFENYRKRVEAEKQSAHSMGQAKSVMKLLPVIDTIERAPNQGRCLILSCIRRCNLMKQLTAKKRLLLKSYVLAIPLTAR